MKLIEIIAKLDSIDQELTIYAETPWSPASNAVVVQEQQDGSLPAAIPETHRYFLEVFLAKEAIAVWRQWRPGREPTLRDRLEAVIHFAKHDAYLPIE